MSTTQPIRNKQQLENFRNYYKTIEQKPRNYALIVFGLNSALRIGDILNLKWQDIRKDNHYRKHITVIECKTGKENIFPLNKASIESLEFYRKAIDNPAENDYIFFSQKAKDCPISRSQAFRIIQKAANATGLDEQHISCHSLRKTFGYHAWKNGTPPALLMSVFNHSSYEITKRYLGIQQFDKDEVYQKTVL